MKHIIILGGGFAGVAAGIRLKKYVHHLKKHAVQVTVIDKNPYHTFTPSLYEVATSEEPQKNIAIPFTEIFDHHITYVKDTVEHMDTKQQTVSLADHKTLSYDYLLIALGSQPAFMHIPGLQQHCIPFKSMKDALHIKNAIKTMCCKEGKCNRKVTVIIGGGGFSGTEIAAELLTYKDKLAKQHKLDKDCLNLIIIQGSDRLLKELDPHVSVIAQNRLSSPQVTFAFGGHITEVTEKEVHTDDGKSYAYNLLIWTGGVKANHFAQQNDLPVNKREQLLTSIWNSQYFCCWRYCRSY
jgi:NADH dehydrogenase